jgi:D-alanyl-D-alanine carboxypeptidase
MNAALLALVLAAPRPSTQLSDEAFAEKFAAEVAASGVPGAALAVFRDGQIVYRQAAGLADLEHGTPYSPDMAFEIGSLSKQFTSTAVLMLVREKKLALSDPIGSLLDELPEAWRAATVEQVMHHVSGIPDYEAIAGYDYYDRDHGPDEVIAVAATRAPSFAPGERFEYSNTGYFLLSRIVERKSGIPFDEFLAKRIFAPLGMSSTYTRARPEHVSVVTGYHRGDSKPTPRVPIAWSATLGAGGIVSTLGDLQRWDEALYGDRLLPADLRAVLWTPATASDGQTIPYGAGWFIDRMRGVAHLSHSGGTNGFSCIYLRFPEQHLSVVGHCNVYGGGPDDALARAAAAHFLPALNYYSLPVPEDDDPETTAEHQAALRQAVLAEGELDLLGDGMQDFATEERYAKVRAPLAQRLATTSSFRRLRVRPVEGARGEPIDEFLYREAHEGGETFWTMRFSAGLLVSLNWEDE